MPAMSWLSSFALTRGSDELHENELGRALFSIATAETADIAAKTSVGSKNNILAIEENWKM